MASDIESKFLTLADIAEHGTSQILGKLDEVQGKVGGLAKTILSCEKSNVGRV
jgi:hypothetical protein